MGVLTFILGRSGTGKSYSMRNFPKDKLAVINVQGKILPFKGSGQIEMTSSDTSREIVKALREYGKTYPSVVVDDFQYVMSNEFMRRSEEHTWDKFTDIARHAWDIANEVRSLPPECIVYIMCHTDRDDEGNEKIKTIGKLLDEKICMEGMSTIVLMTNVVDGVYTFLTQNNGRNTVKSPAGMFPSYAIDNDLWYVDQKIRAYYDLGEHGTEEEIQSMDQQAAKAAPAEGKKKGRRKKEEAPAPEPAPEETKSLTRAKVNALVNAVPETPEGEEALPFEDVPPVEEALPKRRGRKKKEEPAGEAPVMNPPTATTTLYFREKGTNTVFRIEEGEVIPDPSKSGWEEITKDKFEELLAAAAAEADQPAEAPVRRRRRRPVAR